MYYPPTPILQIRKLRLQMFCEVGQPIVGENPGPEPSALDFASLTDPCGLRGVDIAL